MAIDIFNLDTQDEHGQQDCSAVMSVFMSFMLVVVSISAFICIKATFPMSTAARRLQELQNRTSHQRGSPEDWRPY